MPDVDAGAKLEQAIVATQTNRDIPDTNSMIGASTPESDIALLTQQIDDQQVWFNNLLIANVTPLQHLILVRVVSVSAPYLADKDDNLILVDAHVAPITITLPPVVNAKDRYIAVKKSDSSANAVTIVPSGSETIDGASAYTLTVPNAAVEFTNNDSNAWYVVSTSGASELLVFESKTGNYGVTGNDNVILVTCSSADITITLPAANTVANRRIIIKKMDSTSKIVKIVPTGADTIDGAAEFDLLNQYDYAEVISDHVSAWYIVGKIIPQKYPRVTTVTITDPNVSGTAPLSPVEPDTNYKVSSSVTGSTGSASFVSLQILDMTKATNGISITLNGAPGSGASVTYDFLIGRASY